MTKVIILENADIENYYRATKNYLLEKYHNLPTNIPDRTYTQDECDAVGFYDSMPGNTGRKKSHIGKRVV